MATVDTSYRPSISGRPSFEMLDTYIQSDLTAGVEPNRQQPVRVLVSDNQTLPKFSVVGLGPDKRLVFATQGGIAPIGVLEHAVTTVANNTTLFGEVVLTGCYNVGDDDIGTGSPLVWDASFTTAAQKMVATVANALLIFRRRKVI